MITTVDRDRPERDRRIDRLVHDLDLLGTCARACAAAGIPDRIQAVAYCLVAIADKDARPGAAERERPLDVDAPEAAARLAHWAEAVARHMAHWAPTYATIQDEAADYAIGTLRGFVRRSVAHGRADVVDEAAGWVLEVLDGTPPLDEMTLATVRELPPPGNAYVFRWPLSWWIGTIARRRTSSKPPPPPPPPPEPEDIVDTIADTHRKDALAVLADHVALLDETRALLADALALADAWDRRLAAVVPANDEDARALVRVRAALLYEADQLALERRSMNGMLAYVLLAMRVAPRLQHVAVLSLRDAAIDRGAIDDMTARMRALIDDAGHPSPLLLERTRAAPKPVTKSRADALARLRDQPKRRARELAPVAEMLGGLPPTVAGLAEIVTITDDGMAQVTTYRHATSQELRVIDTGYDRVFRRYAMGSRA